MVLAIRTREQRNFYVWSVVGILSISTSFYLNSKQVKEKNGDFSNKDFVEILDIILSHGAFQNITLGCIGLFLTLSSCLKMYLRVGIVPGIYHSTLCIPSWDTSSFTFSISSGFYYGIVGALFSFLLQITQLYVLITPEVNPIFPLQIQASLGIFLMIIIYFYNYETNKEIIGNLITVMSAQLFLINESSEYTFNAFTEGFLLITITGVLLFSIKKSKAFLDNISSCILIMTGQGVIGIFLFAYSYAFDLMSFSYEMFFSILLFAIGIFALCSCETIELVYLCAFPTVTNMIVDPMSSTSANSISSLSVIVFSITGMIIGLVVILFGDLPFNLCRSIDEKVQKSPLHSPLL